MADSNDVQKIVERAVAEALDARLPELRSAVVQRVLEDLKPVLAGAAKPPEIKSESPAGQLDAAIASIHDATAQADVLRALLEGVGRFCGRSALFVVRAGAASGWQSRGFREENAVKGMTLDLGQGLAGRAYSDRTPAAAAAAEFDSAFVGRAGNPHDGNAWVLPLVVKDKVAALLYTDSGTDPASLMDASAVQLVTRSAAIWLELLALRKSGGGTEAAERPEPAPMAAAAAAAAPAPEPPRPAAPPPPPPPPAAEAAVAAEDEEVHKKAKRFAKLLVDEIKLYNQAKVSEGRKHKDLYSRLQEDIEKSRATYEKRYGQTAAGSADYFTKEIVRILANNDESLLGSGFPR